MEPGSDRGVRQVQYQSVEGGADRGTRGQRFLVEAQLRIDEPHQYVGLGQLEAYELAGLPRVEARPGRLYGKRRIRGTRFEADLQAMEPAGGDRLWARQFGDLPRRALRRHPELPEDRTHGGGGGAAGPRTPHRPPARPGAPFLQ